MPGPEVLIRIPGRRLAVCLSTSCRQVEVAVRCRVVDCRNLTVAESLANLIYAEPGLRLFQTILHNAHQQEHKEDHQDVASDVFRGPDVHRPQTEVGFHDAEARFDFRQFLVRACHREFHPIAVSIRASFLRFGGGPFGVPLRSCR